MRPEDIGSFVAARLRQLREERGYSLRQLANRSDLTPEMLSRAERGERTPSLETMARVCSGLGISVAEFFAAQAEKSEPLPREPSPGRPSTGGALTLRAREHFLDAMRSIERGIAAQEQGGAQRRRPKAQHR